MAFQEPTKCGIILENSRTQCINNAWAMWAFVPKCRLHTAYDLAASNGVPENIYILNDFDKPDLENMLSKKQATLDKQREEKEEQEEKEKEK